MARLEPLIVCEEESIGKGVPHSPYRRITSFYTPIDILERPIDPLAITDLRAKAQETL